VEHINLPFGKESLDLRVPADVLAGVLWPKPARALPDAELEIDRVLDKPLGCPTIEEIVHPCDRVLIVIDDYTRATPVQLVLPHLLERIQRGGVQDEQITLLIATGTHRPCTPQELLEKIGQAALERFTVVQHDCMDRGQMTFLGLTHFGTPVWVNRLVMASDRVFGIGHIDPSDFAGYAGGWKLIVPGAAALETINNNHALAPFGFRSYGQTDLPCRLDIDEAGRMTRMHLVVNLILCQDGQIAGVFAGKPDPVHKAGVCLAREIYEVTCPRPVDIMVASGSPYDMDFYQAIRAIEYADLVTRPGGAIVLAAPCPDGLGSEEFFHLLANPGKGADVFLGNIALRKGKVTYNVLGYFLARVRAEKRIYAFTPGVPAAELETIGLTPVVSLQDCVERLLQLYGPNPSLAVLPVGGATIPRLGV